MQVDKPDEAGRRLTPTEVAKRLGVNSATVLRWIATGLLPATRVGSRYRVAAADLVHVERPVVVKRA
mgnify:CR=1 FL=1